MARWPRSELWTFSLALYAGPGVAPACLALQGRHGLDVNLLLYGLWTGISGRGRLSATDLEAAAAMAEAWRAEIVQPLRQVRTRLKAVLAAPPPGMPPAALQTLREAVKAAELDAEHLQQLALAALSAGAAPQQGVAAARRHADAAENATAVLRRSAGRVTAADRRLLESVVAGAYMINTQAVGKTRRRA